jgi:hypothetical protein
MFKRDLIMDSKNGEGLLKRLNLSNNEVVVP